MSKKYRGKYRIESARLQNWDYGSNGIYFITICTKNRQHYFGKIVDKKMVLSQEGKIAHKYWKEIIKHTQHVKLGEFIVMPNHVHGILIIDKPSTTLAVEMLHATSKSYSKISPKPNSIPTIIRSYKSAVSRECNDSGCKIEWQPRFYDRIVWNDIGHQRVINYIKNNPKNWGKDKFNQNIHKCN